MAASSPHPRGRGPRRPAPSRVDALTRLSSARIALVWLCFVGFSLVLATFLSQAFAQNAVMGGY